MIKLKQIIGSVFLNCNGWSFKMIKLKMVVSCMLIVACSSCMVIGRQAKCTFKVVDEAGVKIPNAKVSFSVYTLKSSGYGWGSNRRQRKVVTNANGIYVFRGSCMTGEISCYVGKKGYYGCSQSIRFKDCKLGLWQPWNIVITAVLKKKGKLIPMYMKSVGHIKIPKKGVKVGYDLVKGDWVAPYGKGEIPDFLFEVDDKSTFKIDEKSKKVIIHPNGMRAYDIVDVTTSLTFSNKGDGIQTVCRPSPRDDVQRSTLLLPPKAPKDNYVSKLVQRTTNKKRWKDYIDGKIVSSREQERINYFFRVRTKRAKDGTIKSALYGKIHRNIACSRSGTVDFLYYLNPESNSRNMEYKYNSNLFKDLDSMGRPTR